MRPQKINLKCEKYICENDNLNIINKALKDLNLIIAPMKSGKTYLAQELYKLNRDKIRVFITPRNSLGLDVKRRLEKDFNVKMLFEGDSIGTNDLNKIIITSPESFQKLVNLLDKINEKHTVFAIYDEIHLAIKDLYRKKLYTVLNSNLKNGKIQFTGLTGTPGNLETFIDFNTVIKIDVKEKFKQAKNINIYNIKNINELEIATEIYKYINQNKKVAVRLNNKKMIDDIKELLETKNIKVKIGTSRDNDYVKEIINNDGKLDADVSLFTSFTEVGIEFNNPINTVLLDFEGLNNSVVEPNSIAQNLGRFRNGVELLNIYIERDLDTLKPDITSMYAENKFLINKIVETSLKTGQSITPYTFFNQKNELEVSEDLDFLILENTIKNYNQNLVNNAQDLKNELNKIETLYTDSIEIKEYLESIEPFKEQKLELEEKKKLDRKEKKIIKQNINNLIKSIKKDDVKDLDLEDNINLFVPALKEVILKLHEIDEFKKVNKCYKRLLELKLKLSNLELLKLAIKWENTNKKMTAINNNILRNSRMQSNIHYVKKDNVGKQYAMQNHIMNILEKELKYAGKRIKVSKKILNIILENCKYSDIAPLKKNKYKNLINHLKLYYTVTLDSDNYIFIGKKKESYIPKNLI